MDFYQRGFSFYYNSVVSFHNLRELFSVYQDFYVFMTILVGGTEHCL